MMPPRRRRVMTLTLFAAATVTLTIAVGAQAPRASALKGARTGMIVGQVVDFNVGRSGRDQLED